MGLGVAESSEVPGDCLPDLGRADLALGAGVGERGIAGAAVRSTSVSCWVSASWRFSASDRRDGPALDAESGRGSDDDLHDQDGAASGVLAGQQSIW